VCRCCRVGRKIEGLRIQVPRDRASALVTVVQLLSNTCPPSWAQPTLRRRHPWISNFGICASSSRWPTS
jgi:hypothetical protein